MKYNKILSRNDKFDLTYDDEGDGWYVKWWMDCGMMNECVDELMKGWNDERWIII